LAEEPIENLRWKYPVTIKTADGTVYYTDDIEIIGPFVKFVAYAFIMARDRGSYVDPPTLILPDRSINEVTIGKTDTLQKALLPRKESSGTH